uniref:Uncharacterized protein n=1 Tax=Electrophorus electricus TaxID=8005 RepID=A0A4W4EA20_ELEEL
MVALLPSTGDGVAHAGWVPGSNTGHLPQALVSFPGKLLGVPTSLIICLTLHTVALSHPDHVNHLILAEDGGHRHRLLQTLSRPVNLLSHSATIQLHLHDMGLLLPQRQQVHLHGETESLFLHHCKVLLQLLFACFILPFLAVFGEGLLLAFMPKIIFVESALALITNVLSKDGLERAQTLHGVDVSYHSDHDHRRSLNNSNSLHLLSFGYLCEREKRKGSCCNDYLTLNLTHTYSSIGLVTQECCEVDRQFGIIPGPAAHLPTMPLAPLVGQKAHVPMAWGVEFTVRL